MGKKPAIDYRKLHDYLYNNCDRNHKLLITRKDVCEHFNIPETSLANAWRMLSNAGLINYRKREIPQYQGKNYDYYIMPFDDNNLNRLNDKNSLTVLKEVDRAVQKMIDYFFTEKNEFITVEEIDKKYTGLDDVSADLLYWDLCSLKEYLEDFNSLIEYKKVKGDK